MNTQLLPDGSGFFTYMAGKEEELGKVELWKDHGKAGVEAVSIPNPKKKNSKFTEVKKEMPPVTILMHCRTVVEKKDFVSTGILAYAEGDMLEVEISDYNRFELGENVKLTVYTPAGIYIIPSTIVGRDTGSLMVINPPDNQRRFAEKRAFPRVEVDREGFVASMTNVGQGKRQVFEKPMPLRLRNISLGGIGFSLPQDVALDASTEVEMELDIGTLVPCVAEIVRTQRDSEGVYYGARYTRVDDDKLNSIRAFILREQISAHSAMKKQEDRKRMFK